MTNHDPSRLTENSGKVDRKRWRLSLRHALVVVMGVAVTIGWIATTIRLRKAQAELAALRLETGYLEASEQNQIAAARAPSDLPLTYRVRVRVPRQNPYRVVYSTLWPQGVNAPSWYAAIDVPPGESLVTVQIQEDPRDRRWKITTLIRSSRGTKRVATVLPPDHVAAFRGSHDVINAGLVPGTNLAAVKESIRILDERWLVGEGALMLYGDRPPARDQIGVFAELQPDSGPL